MRLLHYISAGAVAVALVAGPAVSQAASGPNPHDFQRVIDNRYLPLKPGTTFVYRGREEGKRTRAVVQVTHRTKTIQGVRCVVVLDVVSLNGRPIERTFDWYAQDKRGAVWYFGEASYDRMNGRWVRNDGSWEAGVKGARAGIVMKAHPRLGDRYHQEFYRGHAEDQALVIGRWWVTYTPAGTFHHLLVTREFTRLEPGVREHKLYAPGVGMVSARLTAGGHEMTELVSVSHGH